MCYRQCHLAIMKYNYILKVWFTTILVAPIILIISTIISDGLTDSDAFEFILLGVIIGFIFSLPTLFGCLLLILLFQKKVTSLLNWKIILIIFSVIAEILTFFILYGPDSYNPSQQYSALTFSIVYGVCIIAFGIIFRLKPD